LGGKGGVDIENGTKISYRDLGPYATIELIIDDEMPAICYYALDDGMEPGMVLPQ